MLRETISLILRYWHGPSSQKRVPSTLTLLLQSADLIFQLHYDLQRPVHRSHQSATFALPPFQPVDLGATAAMLGLDFLAQAALAVVIVGSVDEFHAACFASAVLVVALVSKAGPTPVPAGESLLIVKAHALSDALVRLHL